jgi:hypothetical protein
VGLNQCSLKRGFKAVFGTSLYAYFQAERMRHAKDLLPNNSVTETAVLLGYTNVSHFSSAFRRHFGVLPSAARRSTPQHGAARSQPLTSPPPRPASFVSRWPSVSSGGAGASAICSSTRRGREDCPNREQDYPKSEYPRRGRASTLTKRHLQKEDLKRPNELLSAARARRNRLG